MDKDYLKDIIESLNGNTEDKKSILNSINTLINTKSTPKTKSWSRDVQVYEMAEQPVKVKPTKTKPKKLSAKQLEKMADAWLDKILKDLPLNRESI